MTTPKFIHLVEVPGAFGVTKRTAFTNLDRAKASIPGARWLDGLDGFFTNANTDTPQAFIRRLPLNPS